MTSIPEAVTGDLGSDYPDYGNQHQNLTTSPPSCSDATCIFLVVAVVIICILGVVGNGLVIWIAGFQLKRSISTTWYLSLSMSDFLFCSLLPFFVIYRIKNDWIFGIFMCKISSFIVFLSMYSSIFLLVIITVNHYLIVRFPVWAQNQRTDRKVSMIVFLAWIISAVPCIPEIFLQEVEFNQDWQKNICYQKITIEDYTLIVVCRFTFGFMIPFLFIGICYVAIKWKVNTKQMVRSSKLFKIMTAVIVTFFICWLPYHTVVLLELNYEKYHISLHIASVFAETLASANSCTNPFLFAIMGKDLPMGKKCCGILSKIQNAIEEDDEGKVREIPAITAGDEQLSTDV